VPKVDDLKLFDSFDSYNYLMNKQIIDSYNAFLKAEEEEKIRKLKELERIKKEKEDIERREAWLKKEAQEAEKKKKLQEQKEALEAEKKAKFEASQDVEVDLRRYRQINPSIKENLNKRHIPRFQHKIFNQRILKK